MQKLTFHPLKGTALRFSLENTHRVSTNLTDLKIAVRWSHLINFQSVKCSTSWLVSLVMAKYYEALNKKGNVCDGRLGPFPG